MNIYTGNLWCKADGFQRRHHEEEKRRNEIRLTLVAINGMASILYKKGLPTQMDEMLHFKHAKMLVRRSSLDEECQET